MASEEVLNNSVNSSRDVTTDMPQLKINGDRLMKTLHEGCKFGADHRYGEYVSPATYPADSLLSRLTQDQDIQQRQAWLDSPSQIRTKQSANGF
jgi:hypothetical protein